MATIFQQNNVHFIVGTISSPTFTFPSGFTEVDLNVSLTLAERQNESNFMTLRLMVDVGGGNFQENFGSTWNGQTEPNKLGNWPGPNIRVFNGADLAGLTCKVEADSTFVTTAGIVVSGF
jgi:FtsP/CotA-like multicopper oxidase with cupredoxin domain